MGIECGAIYNSCILHPLALLCDLLSTKQSNIVTLFSDYYALLLFKVLQCVRVASRAALWHVAANAMLSPMWISYRVA
jgi:hypothetical protein